MPYTLSDSITRIASDAPRVRHPTLVIALHWGTLIAIVISVAAMFIRDAIEGSAWRQALIEIHRQLGLLVLVAVGLRIVVRVFAGLVDHAQGMSALLRRAARLAHVLLYAMLIALPLEGWLLTNAHGIGLSLFGLGPLPNLMASDSEFADVLSDYHVRLAWGLLGLVGMHAAAALWHHYVRRDAVLTAMLPGSRMRD
jgi:cytochrome b561